MVSVQGCESEQYFLKNYYWNKHTEAFNTVSLTPTLTPKNKMTLTTRLESLLKTHFKKRKNCSIHTLTVLLCCIIWLVLLISFKSKNRFSYHTKSWVIAHFWCRFLWIPKRNQFFTSRNNQISMTSARFSDMNTPLCENYNSDKKFQLVPKVRNSLSTKIFTSSRVESGPF